MTTDPAATPGGSRPSVAREVLRVVVPYVAVAGLWIFASDSLVGTLLPDRQASMHWSMVKGFAFVAITGALLSGLLWRQHRRLQALDTEREESRQLAELAARGQSRLVARFEETQQRGHIGSWEWDLDADAVWWSNEVYRIFEVDPATYLPSRESNARMIHREDVETFDAARARVISGEAPALDFDLRIVTPSGVLKHCNAKGSIVRDPVTGTPRFSGTFMDITARKLAEFALRTSEEHQRLLVEHAPAAIAMFDRNMRYMTVSQRWRTDYGLGDAPIVGRTHYEVFPEIPERWKALHRRALAGETLQCNEDPFERADGTIQWVRWELRPWRDDRGEIGGVALFSEDITSRRLAEDQIRAQAALLDLAQDAIVVRDLDGRVRYWNRGAEALYGWTAGEATGKPVEELFGPVTPQILGAREQLVENGTWAGELTRQTRDGREVSIASRWTLVRDAVGRPQSVLVIDTDISDRKRLESQFLQAQKLESIGQLAGGIAHDYNNILAATMLQLELLRAMPDLDAEVRAGLDELYGVTERAVGLTRQLLLFSRRQAVQARRVDLNAVMASLVKMLGRLVGEHIEMSLDPSPEGAWVDADAGMVEQVVMNLAVNARDAMPKGGSLAISIDHVGVGPLESRLHPEARVGRLVRLRVADTGDGMDEPTLKRVFEPFFTTKEIGKGTGLGLATVYGIVRQHRGWVTVTSVPGAGSVFDVFLPVAELPASATGRTMTSAAAGGHETVLLVEDEPAVRRLASSALTRLGYRVVEAKSGIDAVRVWEENAGSIDLLLTDMVMPAGMTGLDLAGILIELKPDLKVLVTSGYSDTLRRLPGNTERQRFLSKPFGPSELAAAVRELLDAKPSP
jgi:two-component system, cell cycle sensor histidine kinase and response regulator CckA